MGYALSPGLVLAAEEETSSGLRLILPDVVELIPGVIAFAIVFFFMWKWAFPAINRSLENRQQAIAGRLEEAENAKSEAESLLQDYRQQLADAKNEANRILEEARQTADAMRQGIVSKANAEAEEIVGKARQEAATERDRALEEARQEVANLSVDLAERLVGQSLDRKAQLGLVSQYLDDLERMAE